MMILRPLRGRQRTSIESERCVRRQARLGARFCVEFFVMPWIRTTRAAPPEAKRRRCTGTRIGRLALVGLLVIVVGPAHAANADATRHWLLGQLQASLAPPQDTDAVSSMLYGLVSDRKDLQRPDTHRLLDEAARLVTSREPDALGCSDAVNLHLVAGFLNSAGLALDTGSLSSRVQDCLGSLSPYDKASALYSLCRFERGVPRERLTAAMDALEALQQADGSFGSDYGLRHFYVSSHAVFALHACGGDALAIQLGQDYLRSALPRLWQAGFIDALMQSLLMLKAMEVEIPGEAAYLDYIRSRVKADGSICCFDRPGCASDRHATSQLLEFFRVFPALK
jgi:hypothetical protein